MNLNADDIKTLAMFAYHRTLVRQDSEALTIYRFLAAIDQDEARWKLGAGLCLIRQHAFQEAKLCLNPLDSQKLAKDQNDLLIRLQQYIAHHQKKSAKKETHN